MTAFLRVRSLSKYSFHGCSVLAKERKSGAPPLLGIQFSYDVVERM